MPMEGEEQARQQQSDNAAQQNAAKGADSQPAAEPYFYEPTHAKLFRVAAGLEEWTEREKEWLQKHPKWIGYERDLRQAIENFERGKFSSRVRRDRDVPPSLGE